MKDLFEKNRRMKSREDWKAKYDFDDNKKNRWIQIAHAIPKGWKEKLVGRNKNLNNLIKHKHHQTKKTQIYFLEKLNRRELYCIQSTPWNFGVSYYDTKMCFGDAFVVFDKYGLFLQVGYFLNYKLTCFQVILG